MHTTQLQTETDDYQSADPNTYRGEASDVLTSATFSLSSLLQGASNVTYRTICVILKLDIASSKFVGFVIYQDWWILER
jgi:hypothetical protein